MKGILHTRAAVVTEKWKKTRHSRSPMSEAGSTHKVCVQDLAGHQTLWCNSAQEDLLAWIYLTIWGIHCLLMIGHFNVITHCFHPDWHLWHGPTGVQFAQGLVGSNNRVLTEMERFIFNTFLGVLSVSFWFLYSKKTCGAWLSLCDASLWGLLLSIVQVYFGFSSQFITFCSNLWNRMSCRDNTRHIFKRQCQIWRWKQKYCLVWIKRLH